jgi:hypothetical protein
MGAALEPELTKALDQLQICDVRRRWAFSLDLGEWDALQACFHPDAKVTVSWYSGPIAGFIERSKSIIGAHKPEEHRKHWLGNMRTQINGTRAVLETDVQILIRDYIDETLCDCTSYARFYDLLERRDGAWRICEWNTIYDKDRVDPVVPSWDCSALYSQVKLQGSQSAFAFMKLRQEKKGRIVPKTIVIRDSEAEKALRQWGARWLAGAAV